MDMDVSQDMSAIAPAVEFLRIKPTTYNVLLFFFLSIAVVTASARTAFRIWRFRAVDADDVLLVLSTVFLCGSVAVAAETRDLSYLQMSVSLGLARPPADFDDHMAAFLLLDDIGGVLTWASIFAVKLSFLLFFKKLVARVRFLETWWWATLGFIVAGACVNIGLNFIICTTFGPQSVRVCTVAGMTHREGIFLEVTTVIDILTDLLIISVPIALLWRVKINLRRKLALGTVCSLSVVMIVLALVRVLAAPVQSPVSPEIPPATDSLWLFVFQNIEASVAVVMVSITAFRSMLGQKGDSRRAKGSHNPHASDPEANKLGSLASSKEQSQSQPQPPPLAHAPGQISAPAPTPPPKDPEGPIAPRRQFGSGDSYATKEQWSPLSHEEMPQPPNARTFI